MKSKSDGFLLLLFFCVLTTAANGQLRAQKNWRDAEPEIVTLLSRATHKDPPAGRSRFSFRYGVRGEVAPEITRSEIEYGSITLNDNSDWFTVYLLSNDRSRIKDLGETKWLEIRETPFLPANDTPHKGLRLPSANETFEQSSDGRVTKVVAGHIYIVRAKDSKTDFYALFRVEKLVSNDEVTISWKLMPKPKK